MTKMLQTRKLVEFAGVRTGLAPMRSATTLLRQQRADAVSISTWERVRSSMWHPMATVEQSLMDMKQMTSQLVSDRTFPHNLFPRVRDNSEDDFFRDLGVNSAKDAPKPSAAKAKSASEGTEQQQPKTSAQGSAESDSGLSYSVYSFSSSTVLDPEGHRVSTVRRRYEDSAGRLKALHEREIDDKKVKSVWRREHPGEEGEHHTICSGVSTEEFEEKWKQTPFGQAETKQQLHKGDKSETSKDSERNESNDAMFAKLADHPPEAFGVDHEAAKAAPDKEHDEEVHGVMKEARERSRYDAIAEGSKNQEEETTPPSYS